MKKYLISFIKFAISVGIGIGVIFWFVGQMSEGDKQQVMADIKRANYLWVAVPPVIGIISNYFRAERWRLLLRPLGYNPGFWNTLNSIMVMYLLNLIFPRLGEVSRCGILARYENVPLDKSIGTMVIERLVDVICLGILGVVLVIFERDKFAKLYDAIITNSSATFGDIIAKYQISPQVKYGVMGSVLLAVILFILYQASRLGWKNIIDGLKERIIGMIRGIISIKDIGNPGMFIFHTVMIWVGYYLMAYLGFYMFPETSGLSLMAAATGLFFGAASYALTPGGLGVYPIFIKTVLTLYGVTGSAAISLGLVSWAVQTIVVIVVGVISLVLLAIMNRESSLKEVTLKT